MVTLGELLLELVKSIIDLKNRYKSLDRDKRDRIANYMEHIANTLDKIVSRFESGEEFTGMKRELRYYVSDSFYAIIKDVVSDKDKATMLCDNLRNATNTDYFLWDVHLLKLKGKEVSRTIANDQVLDVSYLKYRFQNSKDFSGLNVRDYLTERKLDVIVNQELDRIRETSGLFRAVAVEIRATN